MLSHFLWYCIIISLILFWDELQGPAGFYSDKVRPTISSISYNHCYVSNIFNNMDPLHFFWRQSYSLITFSLHTKLLCCNHIFNYFLFQPYLAIYLAPIHRSTSALLSTRFNYTSWFQPLAPGFAPKLKITKNGNTVVSCKNPQQISFIGILFLFTFINFVSNSVPVWIFVRDSILST